MCKNCSKSVDVLRPHPSAMLEGIEIADLLIWFVKLYISSWGNFPVIL